MGWQEHDEREKYLGYGSFNKTIKAGVKSEIGRAISKEVAKGGKQIIKKQMGGIADIFN